MFRESSEDFLKIESLNVISPRFKPNKSIKEEKIGSNTVNPFAAAAAEQAVEQTIEQE